MIFTELRFLAFFAGVFAVYWALEHNTARKLWLLLTSFVFYAAWDWRFLSLIVVSILVDYVVGRFLATVEGHRARQLLLSASLAANLGMLALFKYFGFFVDSALQFGELLGFELSRPALTVVLPVGISFFTFQTLSYSIDVYRRKIEPTKNLLDLSLFVAFFPQLVAGPIVRAAAFLPQLQVSRTWQSVATRRYVVLFLVGFAKKACLSDNIAAVVDAYFASPESYTAQAAWIAILLFAIQIYCDFSGYSDMAIAIAGLLGYDLGPNFRHPYIAASLREFWQRWHISLSSWLRDYLYVALGGNRRGSVITYRNLILVMLLGGLWHGAAWHFVFWGALHGGALALERLVKGRRRSDAASSTASVLGTRWLGTAVGVLLTQYWVCLAWIFFRAEDFSSALGVARSYLFFASPGELTIDPRWWILIAAFFLAHQILGRATLHGWQLSRATTLDRLPSWAFASGYGVASAIVILFVQVDVQPFIYFQF